MCVLYTLMTLPDFLETAKTTTISAKISIIKLYPFIDLSKTFFGSTASVLNVFLISVLLY